MGAHSLRLYEASQGGELCMVQEAIQGGQHIGAGLLPCRRLHEACYGEDLCMVHAI